jgi:hypothetical protein
MEWIVLTVFLFLSFPLFPFGDAGRFALPRGYALWNQDCLPLLQVCKAASKIPDFAVVLVLRFAESPSRLPFVRIRSRVVRIP